MDKRIVIVVLLIFYFLGLKLRVEGTLEGFFAFTFDQGRDFLELSRLVNEHKIGLIGPSSGIEGVFHGVWWFWFLAPIFWLWRGDPTLVVATFNVISALFILVAFYVGRKIKDDRLGLIVAGLFSVSPHFVGTGAQLWNPNMVPLLLLLVILAIWQFLKKKWHFWRVALIVGFMCEFAIGSAGLYLPAFIMTFLFFKMTPSRKEVIPALSAFGIWFVPRILFELRHNFLQTKSVITFVAHPSGKEFVLPLFARFQDRLTTLFYLFKDGFTGGSKEIAALLLAFFPIALVYLIKRQSGSLEKKLVLILLTIVSLIVAGATIYPNALWNYYLIGVPALLLLPVSLALYGMMNRFPLAGLSLFAFLLVLNALPQLRAKIVQGDVSVFRNQLQVVEAIYQDAKGTPFNAQVYTPPMIDYTYQYLFKWRGRDFKNTPDRNNEQKLVYMIVEPDIWHEELKQIWLRERIGDGTIVGTKCFFGGIDVAKKLR